LLSLERRSELVLKVTASPPVNQLALPAPISPTYVELSRPPAVRPLIDGSFAVCGLAHRYRLERKIRRWPRAVNPLCKESVTWNICA
jgi:hypothetical protein